MSICNECWGKGWIEKQGVQFDCRKCKGTGVIENEPQTNEEWFCGLDTENKAREISDMTAQGYWEEELVYKWLKEKHNG